MLTADRLRACLSYDAQTGEFRRLLARGNCRVGEVAGTISGSGHRVIRVDGRSYKAARLAWLHTFGEWPSPHIDHINGVRSDDRLRNLRPATPAQNSRNRQPHKTRTSGHLKGTYWHKANRKWTAAIMVDGSQTYLGSFDCPAAAHLAYVVAADKFHGEFARSN
jgi:hypothetical protein